MVCLDAMGPQSARSYPGRRVVKPAPPKAQRAKQEIDYGRRGKGYVFGAPEFVEGPFVGAGNQASASIEFRQMQGMPDVG